MRNDERTRLRRHPQDNHKTVSEFFHLTQEFKALDEASAKGWTVVDMKQDWEIVFPFEKP